MWMIRVNDALRDKIDLYLQREASSEEDVLIKRLVQSTIHVPPPRLIHPDVLAQFASWYQASLATFLEGTGIQTNRPEVGETAAGWVHIPDSSAAAEYDRITRNVLPPSSDTLFGADSHGREQWRAVGSIVNALFSLMGVAVAAFYFGRSLFAPEESGKVVLFTLAAVLLVAVAEGWFLIRQLRQHDHAADATSFTTATTAKKQRRNKKEL